MTDAFDDIWLIHQSSIDNDLSHSGVSVFHFRGERGKRCIKNDITIDIALCETIPVVAVTRSEGLLGILPMWPGIAVILETQ